MTWLLLSPMLVTFLLLKVSGVSLMEETIDQPPPRLCRLSPPGEQLHSVATESLDGRQGNAAFTAMAMKTVLKKNDTTPWNSVALRMSVVAHLHVGDLGGHAHHKGVIKKVPRPRDRPRREIPGPFRRPATSGSSK